MSAVIRRAGARDALAVARLYRRAAEATWPFLVPHTPDQDLRFFARAIERGPVWLSEDADELVGFCVARRGWIDHLFVAPERQGEGIGRLLLARALKGRTHVRLWTFQCNVRARSIYRRAGFEEIRFTDGRDNEEREPDVLLHWRAAVRRPSPPRSVR